MDLEKRRIAKVGGSKRGTYGTKDRGLGGTSIYASQRKGLRLKTDARGAGSLERK